MGKSIRSKRNKRLRTLKREIAVPHYDLKEAAKMAVQEAALAAPKIELPKKKEEVEDEAVTRGRTGGVAMAIDTVDSEAAKSPTDSKLKAKGGIRKRGKSRKRDLAGKRKKQVKF